MARLRRCRVGVRVGPRERLGGCCEGSRWLGGGVGVASPGRVWLACFRRLGGRRSRRGGHGHHSFGARAALARITHALRRTVK